MEITLVQALIAALVTVLCALIGGLPQIMLQYANLKQSRLNGEKTDENTAITKVIETKAVAIHEQTNGNLTAAKEALAAKSAELVLAQSQIKFLTASVVALIAKGEVE